MEGHWPLSTVKKRPLNLRILMIKHYLQIPAIPYYVPQFLDKLAVAILLRYREIKYGYPFRLIELTRGKYAKVDPEDYEKLIGYNWFAVKELHTFYAQRNENGKSVKIHRQIMNPPPGLFVDHQNHDGLDNRKANLRIATPAENSRNKKKQGSKTSSKYKGVYLAKWAGKWRAAIYHNGKCIQLGYFDNEPDAAKAYDKAAKLLFGEFASLNFG
jgi:hypothetical protein